MPDRQTLLFPRFHLASRNVHQHLDRQPLAQENDVRFPRNCVASLPAGFRVDPNYSGPRFETFGFHGGHPEVYKPAVKRHREDKLKIEHCRVLVLIFFGSINMRLRDGANTSTTASSRRAEDTGILDGVRGVAGERKDGRGDVLRKRAAP
jgi:hypothetical protein